MILDSSALVAILFKEADAHIYLRAVAGAEVCRISAANYVEAAMVIEGQTHPGGGNNLNAFLRNANIIIEPFTVEQAHLARQAFLDYGKGRHAAGLNFGDCFAYALSKATREPLLFKGVDFVQTGIAAAL